MTDFGINFVKKLKPIKFRYDKDKFDGHIDDRIHFGFSAQELAEVVSEDKYAIVTKDPRGYYMINYIELISPLAKGLQEALVEIDGLKEEIRLLKENMKG